MDTLKNNIQRFFAKRANWYYLAAILVVGVGLYFYTHTGAPVVKTEVVHAGHFIQTISVAGKVTPSKDVDLGFTNAGRIVQVYGDVGTHVAQGQLLAAIDSSDIRANLAQRQAALATQQARLDAIKAGARPEDIAVAQSSVDAAATALMRSQGAIVQAIRDAYIRSDDAIRGQVYQFVTNARTSSPQITFTSSDSQSLSYVQSQIVTIENLLNEWQGEVSLLSDTSDVSAAATHAQAHLADVSALLARTSTLLSYAQPNPSASATQIAAYTAAVATARTSVSTADAAITSALTAQKNAAASLETAKKNLQLKQAGAVQTDIDAQAAQVRAAEADVENVRAQLGKTSLVAPFSGIITKMDAKVGLIASPNTPVVSMIGSGAFRIESYVPEVNIGLVKVGDTAKVTLDAYGTDVLFDARVVSIDPAATVRDGVPTYRALLQFADADERIKSGMTANIVITTAEKDGVLSVPQGLITERDGKKFVQIQQGKATSEREITIGAISSLGNAEVLSGLSDGDVIIIPEGQ